MGFLPSIGFGELILILALTLLIFGAGKLPEAGRALGRSLVEFRQAIGERNSQLQDYEADLIQPDSTKQ